MEVWTDGCCLRNPGGPGGWAAILVAPGGGHREFSGHSRSTTNNAMELTAALEGLRHVDSDAAGSVVVVTDSRYVELAARRGGWMYGWQRNGWRKGRAGNGPAPSNVELWRALYEETLRCAAQFRWVKGHNGAMFNVAADQLALAAARRTQ